MIWNNNFFSDEVNICLTAFCNIEYKNYKPSDKIIPSSSGTSAKLTLGLIPQGPRHQKRNYYSISFTL
jgi:hypothetical protein